MLFRKIKNMKYESMSLVYTSPQGNQIWLGDYYAATDIQLLKEKKIYNVLTAAAMLPIRYSKQINHKIINAFDIPTYKMTPHFQQAYEFIKNSLKTGNILVHCAAGISRSTTCVIVYLMMSKGYSYSFSLQYIRKKRSIVNPNYGFRNELNQLQISLKKKGILAKYQDKTSQLNNKNDRDKNKKNIYNSLDNKTTNIVNINLNLNLNIKNIKRRNSLNQRKTIGSDHILYPGLKFNNKILQVKKQL